MNTSDSSADATSGTGLPPGWACFAITTADRVDRRHHLEREVARAGIAVDLHVGVRPESDGGFASTGVRGCFESHLACMRKARSLGVEVCVLAEDDLLLVRGARRALRRMGDELAGVDWTMVYFGFLPASPMRQQPIQLITSSIARAEGWEVQGTHFLAIRGSALDAVIANFEQRLQPGGHRIGADGVFNEFRRDEHVDTLVSLPRIAHQGSSPSGITAPSKLKHHLVYKKPVRVTIERVKRIGWNLVALVPARVLVAVWNRRVCRTRQ